MSESIALWRIIVGYGMFLVTALSLGLAALRVIESQLIRSERVVVGIVLGASLLSPLVFLLAILHCAYGWIFASIAFFAAITLFVKRRWLFPSVANEMAPMSREWMWLLISVVIGFGVFVYGKQAISPEHSSDGITYHLGQVNLYANAHAMKLLMDMFSALPQGMEMLFLYVFPIGAHSAAALVHFTFLVCLPIMISFYGRRIGNYPAGVAAGLLVFGVPLIGMDGSAAYNDVALATVCFTALFLMEVGRASSRMQELYAAAFLAGFAFSIKYTAAFFILFAGALLVYYLRRQPRMLASALIALSFGPVLYLARNAIVFHDPVAFFGNKVFPNPFFHISFEENYLRNQANVNGIRWGLVPGELLRGGPKLDGSFGVVFILLPIALIGLLWPATRFLLLSAAVLALSYPANKAARFAIPFFPPLVLAFTTTLSWLCRSDLLLCTIVVAHLTLSSPPIFRKVFPNGGWHPDPPSWRVALRLDSAREYLSQSSEECKIAFQIDRAIEPAKKIFAFGGVGQAYMRQPLYVSFQSAIAEEVADILWSTWQSESRPRQQWTAHFQPTEVNAIRLVRRGKPEELPWSISEITPMLGQ